MVPWTGASGRPPPASTTLGSPAQHNLQTLIGERCGTLQVPISPQQAGVRTSVTPTATGTAFAISSTSAPEDEPC
jgi:hypothetical protein